MVRSRLLSFLLLDGDSLLQIALVLRISSCLAMHHCHITTPAIKKRDRVEQQASTH